MVSLDYSNIVTKYVCPGLGVILANVMFAAPVKSLMDALSKGDLGDLNPVPWALMTGTCLGWTAYGFLKKDLFVLLANAPPLLLSVWLNAGAIKLQYLAMYQKHHHLQLPSSDGGVEMPKLSHLHIKEEEEEENNQMVEEEFVDDFDTQDKLEPDMEKSSFISSQEKLLLLSLTIWLSLLSFMTMSSLQTAKMEIIVGLVVNVNLVFFYGAPLSTIQTVIATKNSISIHRTTLFMVNFNTFFWLIYGMAIMDFFIFIPNLCGFILGIIQVALCIKYPSSIQ